MYVKQKNHKQYKTFDLIISRYTLKNLKSPFRLVIEFVVLKLSDVEIPMKQLFKQDFIRTDYKYIIGLIL